MSTKPPQNKYSVKLKRGSTALVGLDTRENISKEELEQHIELAKRPLRKNATKGKSPIEAGLIVLRHITYRTGSNAIPVGYSTLDKLQSLRTDPAMELLKNYTWSDFFQQRQSSKTLTRPSSASSLRSQSSSRSAASPIKSQGGSAVGFDAMKSSSGKTSPLRLFTNSIKDNLRSSADFQSDNGEITSLTDDNIGTENMCLLFEQLVSRTESFWKQLRIPSRDQKFYKQTLLKYPPTCIDQCNELGKYIDVLHAFKQATIVVVRAIEQRELILESFMDFLHTLQSGMNREENFRNASSGVSSFWKDEFISQILLLRNSTLVAIKYIQQWRQSLWRPLPFFYENRNYLLKIKSDLNILLSSKFKGFLEELNLGFQNLVCLVWPDSGIAFDLNGVEGVKNIDEVKQNWLVGADDNDKFTKKLRGNSENKESENSIINKCAIAAKVVADETALQNALSTERDCLKLQGVFIPFLKL